MTKRKSFLWGTQDNYLSMSVVTITPTPITLTSMRVVIMTDSSKGTKMSTTTTNIMIKAHQLLVSSRNMARVAMGS